jgi:UDP-N-acetylmuramoyl-L-alanyl-D-glutamate--2,6-diaminopimelate ligase
MLVKTLLRGVEIIKISDKKLLNENILNISYDDREIKDNSIFFAIRGTSFDTHSILHRISSNKKIKCFITEVDLGIENSIVVKNSREAFAIASFNYFEVDYYDFIRIGITGTNGKTTISHIADNILKSAALNTINIGTTGYFLLDEFIEANNTTPGSYELASLIRKGLDKGANALVMEVSSHALSQDRVSGLRFDVAVFSNLSGDHLDYHLNMENYYNEKKKLFDNLQSKKAVINIDNEYGKRLYDEISIEKIKVSVEQQADIYVKESKFSLNSTKAVISFFGKDIEIETSLIGKHNLSNILCAAGATYLAGISIENIINGIKTVENVAGRLEKIVIDDAYFFVDYAHTDDALENVLKTLNDLKISKIITLFGCGGDRDKTKRPRMAAVAEKYSDLVIVTSDNPRTENPENIIDDILKGFSNKDVIFVNKDRAQAIKLALDLSDKNDIILIAGKGHEDYQILGTEKIHFDDREELKKLAGII